MPNLYELTPPPSPRARRAGGSPSAPGSAASSAARPPRAPTARRPAAATAAKAKAKAKARATKAATVAKAAKAGDRRKERTRTGKAERDQRGLREAFIGLFRRPAACPPPARVPGSFSGAPLPARCRPAAGKLLPPALLRREVPCAAAGARRSGAADARNALPAEGGGGGRFRKCRKLIQISAHCANICSGEHFYSFLESVIFLFGRANLPLRPVNFLTACSCLQWPEKFIPAVLCNCICFTVRVLMEVIRISNVNIVASLERCQFVVTRHHRVLGG